MLVEIKLLKKPSVQVCVVAMAAAARGEVPSWGAGLSCRRGCLTAPPQRAPTRSDSPPRPAESVRVQKLYR